ncbi:MAG: efflux transporter periplasmic adaptor subunit [Cupriavidus sp.]|nr:efflux transporter periplasmic adaptor subunit [Cupriavidus sp.]
MVVPWRDCSLASLASTQRLADLEEIAMQVMRARRALIPGMLAIAVTVLTACGKENKAPEAQTPEVKVVTLKVEAVTLDTSLPGRTLPYRIAEVRPQVNGILQKRLFVEGSDVKQGQQLYQIDPSTYEATAKSAEANLESARLLAERYGRLVGEEAVSKQQYAEAQAAYLQAKAAVDQAHINLRYTKVLSPISGRIGRSLVTEGALVTSGQATALTTIQQLDPIFVDVTQPSSSILRLRRDLEEGRLQAAGDNAARVTLQLEDGSTYSEAGRMEFSEVAVDQGTGSVTLRAVFPNPRHELLPGMFVHARLAEGVKESAILAPQRGVTRDLRGQPTALVVNANDEVELRMLGTSRTIGPNWLVTDGLKAGDRVIVQSLQFVRPGVKVKAAEATAAQAGTGPAPAPAASAPSAKS